MGHDKGLKMSTCSVSDIGHVNLSCGTVPSAMSTCWRQPLPVGCILFKCISFFKHKIRQGVLTISVAQIYYCSTTRSSNSFSV